MREREDQDLRDHFDSLKGKDRERVPDFQSLMAGARREASAALREGPSLPRKGRPVPRRLAWGGSLLAAAAAALVLLVQVGGTSDSEFVQVVQAYSSDPSTGAWRSPTDALLDLPGSEILSTVPTLDSSRRLMGAVFSPERNDL